VKIIGGPSVRTRDIVAAEGKKKTKKQSAEATLTEVIEEMAKPRVALSARENMQTSRKAVLVGISNEATGR
jgi:hypothetical protein